MRSISWWEPSRWRRARRRGFSARAHRAPVRRGPWNRGLRVPGEAAAGGQGDDGGGNGTGEGPDADLIDPGDPVGAGVPGFLLKLQRGGGGGRHTAILCPARSGVDGWGLARVSAAPAGGNVGEWPEANGGPGVVDGDEGDPLPIEAGERVPAGIAAEVADHTAALLGVGDPEEAAGFVASTAVRALPSTSAGRARTGGQHRIGRWAQSAGWRRAAVQVGEGHPPAR